MLVLHHDHPSPASAVAVLRLQRLADEGLEVSFSGLETLPLDAALPVTLDVLAELDRWRDPAAELGLELRRPSRRPTTGRAHLVAAAVAEPAGLGASWRLACYRGYWEQDLDLGDPAVLLDLAATAGLDAERTEEVLHDTALLAGIRRRAHTLRGSGVGGVPVLSVDGALVPGTLSEDELRQLAALR
ncbi:MAG: DsbA family protein [Actinomycetes bacterium]